jgi:hypothetical protein
VMIDDLLLGENKIVEKSRNFDKPRRNIFLWSHSTPVLCGVLQKSGDECAF